MLKLGAFHWLAVWVWLVRDWVTNGTIISKGCWAGAFERGILAGGIATTLFYVTIGRTGSVSDVEYMARTSTLSKTTISAIYGGIALLHIWRISHDDRYTRFFARPDPLGGMHVGLSLDQ